MRILSVGLILCLWCATSFAVTHALYESGPVTAADYHYGDLAQSRILAATDSTEPSNAGPESGDLIIPGEEEAQDGDKLCLNVCKKWGENCVINPRTGQRQCRKTCKEFGEECF